jgi:polysaccharide pyruvyl transferase WcaK-like protein
MIHRPYLDHFEESSMEERHSLKFARTHYDISPAYHVNEIKKLNDVCDAFVLGADQLWKYDVTKIFGHSYFLDFARKNKTKISYATSFGTDRFTAPKKFMWKAVRCLRRMNYVSVREKVNVNMCEKLFGIKAEHVLDPVLLCDNRCLGTIADESDREIKSNYIAAYILDPTPEKREALLRMAKKYNKDLIVMLDGWPHLFKANKEKMDLDEYIVSDVNVNDWLFYFKHSDMIITDSFHGTCMALLFEKPFYAIANAGRGADRFISLLDQFELMDRFVWNPDDIGNVDDETTLDYTRTNEILSKEREKSMSWLENALNSKEKNHSVVIRKEVLFPLRVRKSIKLYEESKR